MAYRIFISHSSHSETAKSFVTELSELLRRKGFEVFLEFKDIQSADDWNKEIHERLASCHAGVLLLTPESITRPWVLKEATILTWRRSLQPDCFKLFPVVFDGVTDQALEQQKFGPLVISSIQKIAGRTPEAIAEEIKQVIGAAVETDTPLDQLAAVLADLLAPPVAGRSTAERLARKLGIDETRWAPNEPADLSRVLLIAGRLLQESLGHYKGVYDLMSDLLPTMSNEFARKTLTIVAPYWVPADAAGRLCEIVNRSQRWAVAMNGVYLRSFSFKMYLRRAFPLREGACQLNLAGGGSEAMIEETVEEIYFALEGLWHAERNIIPKLLATNPDPLFVVLPREVSDEAALGRLESEFPRLTFVLDAGKDAGALDSFAALSHVEALRPALDIGKEERAYLDYLHAESIFARRNPSLRV